jgi:hypothetical protein
MAQACWKEVIATFAEPVRATIFPPDEPQVVGPQLYRRQSWHSTLLHCYNAISPAKRPVQHLLLPIVSQQPPLGALTQRESKFERSLLPTYLTQDFPHISDHPQVQHVESTKFRVAYFVAKSLGKSCPPCKRPAVLPLYLLGFFVV